MALDRSYYNSLVDETSPGSGTPVDKVMIDALFDEVDKILVAIDDKGALAFAASTELTIATDAVTLTAGKNVYSIDTESNAASDNLTTITLDASGREARFLILKPENAARLVTVKHGTGNIHLKGGDFAMNDADHRLMLVRDGSTWYELSRNAGGTPAAHAASHKSGGSDAIALDELAAQTDIATLNASTTAHGLLKKLSNVATEFLNGVGNWAVPGLPAIPTSATQLRCNIYNSAGQTIATATDVVLTFDTERADVGPLHSTSSNTGRITVPTGGAGLYLIGVSVDFETNGTGQRQGHFRLNGSTNRPIHFTPTNASFPITLAFTETFELADGDYVEALVYQDSGGNLAVGAASRECTLYAVKLW